MPSDGPGGPAQLVLTASIARRYYLDGRSKVEIAEEHGISRFKVARLLQSARDSGLVRIEIHSPGPVDVDLSSRLQDAFGLRHAVVVDTRDDHPESMRWQLGRAAAELLGEVLTPKDVLGLAWARSVSAMAAHIERLPSVAVVQLTGALSRPDGDDSSVDVVRSVARATGGPAYFFYTPMLVASARTARSLRSQPDVARAVDKIASVTFAVVGVGRWAAGQSTVYDAASPRERRALERQGVCADVGGVFLSEDGAPIATSLSERMVGISARQLTAIDDVVGIPYGTAKAAAVNAAIRGGVLKSVVTHTTMAQALLAGE